MEEKENKKWWGNPFIIIAAISIIIVYGSYIYNFYNQTISKNSGDWGTFGDFIGGTLNPTLAFLSLLAILQTIRIQSRELGNSTKALENSEKELAKSSKALEEQSKSLKTQNFETTFFNMISLHNEIINNLKIKNHYLEYEYLKLNDQKELKTVSGNIKKTVIQSTFDKVKKMPINETISEKRESIKDICTNIDNFIKDRNSSKQYASDIYKVNDLTTNRKPTLLYDLCHQSYSDLIGHYFGNIYQILKHISTSKDIKDMEDKRKYSDLFRAQFSAQELKLLFYHCSDIINSRKFKIFIEEFKFLEYLNIEEDNEFFKYIFYHNIYKNEAFGFKNNEEIELLTSEDKKESLRKNDEIQLLKNRIINKINTQIEKIKDKYKYKYKYMYKYFSEEDIKKILQIIQADKELSKSLAYKLIILDYSEEDSIKNYTFREE